MRLTTHDIEPVCSIPGCNREIEARGWCTAHYCRWKRHGSPLPDKPVGRPSLRERLFSYVDQTDACWMWTGTLDREGYGRIKVNGAFHGAHRATYELLKGSIPNGLVLDHLCHTNDRTCPGGPSCMHRRCVNPDHLEPVTQGENSRRGGNAAKTHCVKGHEFNQANTYWCKGHRYCRLCGRATAKRFKDRKRRLL